jgi:hypothetical protein
VLRQSGARVTCPHVAALLADLDGALRQSSPLDVPLTWEVMKALMDEATGEARRAGAAVACVLARADGTVLARLAADGPFPAGRPEPAILRQRDARDLVLATTLEPDLATLGAAMAAGVDAILYALPDLDGGGTGRFAVPLHPAFRVPRVVPRVGEGEGRRLAEEWLAGSEDGYLRHVLASLDREEQYPVASLDFAERL